MGADQKLAAGDVLTAPEQFAGRTPWTGIQGVRAHPSRPVVAPVARRPALGAEVEPAMTSKEASVGAFMAVVALERRVRA